MKRFLVTTADERTWRSDRPLLFLGEWCRSYDRRSAWEHLDAEVVPYHWDDRQKYYEDYPYLQSVYEELLSRTGAALNEHHGTERSARYWRILIGPWLYAFTHTLFDRWTMVQKASAAYEIEGTLIYEFPLASTISPNLQAVNPDSTTWNHYLFGRAIECQSKIQAERIPAPGESPAKPRSRPRRTLPQSARRGLHAAVSWLLARFTKSDEVLIIRSYLPRFEEIKLQLALGQVPKLWKAPSVCAVPPDLPRRRRLRIASDGADAFFRFAVSMVPEQIPTVYLEGYRNLRDAAERLPWPSRPRAIFTSNLFQFCEVFQEWAAAKAEEGCPLVAGQHGGMYGVGKWVPSEDHQSRISDRFLTWGWQDDRPQPHPTALLTSINKPCGTWNPAGNLLLVTVSMRQFSYRSMSWPVAANQSTAYIGEQLRFVGAVADPIRASLTLRIDQAVDRQMRSFYIEKWKDAWPAVEIDPSTEPIERRVRQCRLFVYTYNGTGFVETLARNIPTVIFWNPRYFELRASAQPYFDLLEEARIYHRTPESAAQHATHVWDNVAEWWNQPAVQQARRIYCEQYARMPKNPIRVLKQALRTVTVRSHMDTVSTCEPLTGHTNRVAQ